MRHMMAHTTDGMKACELLDGSLFVVVPSFMAVQLTLRSADAASIDLVCVNLLPKLVPLRLTHLRAKVLVPARLRDEVDLQLEAVVVHGGYRRTLYYAAGCGLAWPAA